FLNEVVPVLTRAGCNQGACHGKGAGQNGFRLSLRGYAPEQDHRWLTREFDGRRLDPAHPEDSLLLKKATAQLPHEGRRLFAVTVVSMPFDRPTDPSRFVARGNFIDEHLFAKLKELRIEPSDGCTDGEFVRRVFLDACGLLPTPDEVRAFLADPDPHKREKLI